jgi:tetratricopeptide (TPR) repeat protein
MTKLTNDFDAALAAASKLLGEGDAAQAEQALLKLASEPAQRLAVLPTLADLYLKTERPQQALETLVELVKEIPDNLRFTGHLADLLQRMGRVDAAIAVYERFLLGKPGSANAHFSLALAYKAAYRYHDAMLSYEKAIKLDVDNVQEVYSNMGVLFSDMHDSMNAAEMYRRALQTDAKYVPAMFNFATLYEEVGERENAAEMYENILTENPRHWDSLARLAYLRKVEDESDPLIERLQAGSEQASGDSLSQETLYFSLGKTLDDVAMYDKAFAAYRKANEIGEQRSQSYDAAATEQAIDGLIKIFDKDWISKNASEDAASPIFICGMFRSGSTLVEQMVSAHPVVVSGGELDFLPWLIARYLSPYPSGVSDVSAADISQIGQAYLTKCHELFPSALNLTDKRPDNVMHLGLIKAMFPAARIVYTTRNLRDNCLSVYFQQFGGNLSYATSLTDTADYYKQQSRLMDHWKKCFGNDIIAVDYDELVGAPEPVLRKLLKSLGLPWDERCMNFDQSSSSVKTASVWQVRDKLHTDSRNRWRNYVSVSPELDSLPGN